MNGGVAMSNEKKNDILKGINVDDLLKVAVKESVRKHLPVEEEMLQEAYVAQQKPYSQVTEFLTQKTKDAHTRLYQGYIETINRVSAELDTADRSNVDARHNSFRSGKMDEAYNLNSVWLHELYFANCFDPNSTVYMDSISYLRLQRDWGDFDSWQKDFMATALAVGEGWAVCGYHLYLRRYVNTFVCHHSDSVMLGLYPVVVVDMWSHSYYRDYLDDKKSYLVAQMREFNWDVIDERFKKAEGLAGVVK